MYPPWSRHHCPLPDTPRRAIAAWRTDRPAGWVPEPRRDRVQRDARVCVACARQRLFVLR